MGSNRMMLAALVNVGLTVTLAAVLGAAPGEAAPSATAPRCFGKPATIVGTGYLTGTPGPDVIVARGGAEVHAHGGDDRVCGAILVYGGAGDDRIRFGGRGGDYPELSGQGGDDLVVLTVDRVGHLGGGGGDDTLRSRGAEQFLDGGPGADVLVAGPGSDSLFGMGSDDRLVGGRGSDTVDGRGGDDLLEGGRGNDELVGGRGDDTGRAGAGTDRCHDDVEHRSHCERS
ncbi:calcium-binding protein [Nocardioides sp. MAHUQ-72]|uniref:calcium-binding protein n=1 Tax=unclassified Nocardioides TaxID=2615069 RepID=UPI00361E8D50